MRIAERINRPIVLQRCSIQLLLDARSVCAQARVILRLSPNPRVVIEYDLPSDEAAASNEIRSKRTVCVQLEQGTKIDALVGNYLAIGGGKISGVLIPKEQPVTVFNNNLGMNRCKFALINFPSIWGKQDIYYTKERDGKALSFVTQHLKFEANPWVVEITGVDSLMGVDNRLKLEGGSAVTHFGSITQAAGQDFSLDELSLFLESLHLFLSFARGSYCGLTLLSAQDSNRRRVWQQWGTYKTEPWHRELPTWVDGLQSQTLSSMFEGFWKLYANKKWRESISKVVSWYLRSNDANESEVGIVLTQAALEHLTYNLAGKRPNNTKEGGCIASALTTIGIDVKIPPQCKELLGIHNRVSWSHGPHALVDLRNNLVHADNRLGGIPSNAHSEAWDLGQWYVELILLHLFGYTGRYSSRIKLGAGSTSEIEPVPWATQSV